LTKPLCIYHGNCADGFTAAYAVWKRFGDAFDYHAGVYQNAPPGVTGRDVVLVDFSYKRETLREMARDARSMLVLDHHKTTADDLYEDLATGDGPAVMRMDAWSGDLTWERHLGNVELDQSQGAPFANVYAYFDMNRSGAGIAWDFFHGADTRPKLVKYAEDRDLWRFALPFSRAVNAYIFAHEYTFDAWDSLAAAIDDDTDGVVRMGVAIEKKHHKDVAELVGALKRRMTIGGHEVWAASLPYTLTSDAGHLMAKGELFAACYWDTPEGRVFSLRSTDEGLDVSMIAKAYGGGGHRNASGFRLPHGVSP
jgi:uncharacterized protein